MAEDHLFTFSKDQDKTVIRPSPGGRRGRLTQHIRQTSLQEDEPFRMGGGFKAAIETDTNPLLSLSFTLLSLVPKLRVQAFHHTINDLQERLVDQIKAFETGAAQRNISTEVVRKASYFICSLIDETILNTPWGEQSNWGNHGLLIMFHRQAQGGEIFFQLLASMMKQPEKHLHLLELAYFCLSLGFQGKYRMRSDGLRRIDQWRRDLYGCVQRSRIEPEQGLSINWEGIRELRRTMMRYIPFWVLAVVAGLLLMLIYLGISYTINHASDRAYKQLIAIAQKKSTARAADIPVATEAPPAAIDINHYKALLAEEIAQNMVAVVSGPTVRISNAFSSGSDQLKKRYLPILSKLAEDLRDEPRRLDVVGHTDDRPIFSARFPSNWHLSKARAERVAMILISFNWLESHVYFAGHADNEPIVSNDTPNNRAINRRIDIHIR